MEAALKYLNQAAETNLVSKFPFINTVCCDNVLAINYLIVFMISLANFFFIMQPEYVKVLSDVLHHGSNSSVARMAAGIQLKNTLASNDAKVKTEYQRRWLAFPQETRAYIKNNVRRFIVSVIK